VFGFVLSGEKIWFTEWVENNIGVVDTSKPLPFDLQVSQTDVTLIKGQSVEIQMQLIPKTNAMATIYHKTASQFNDISVQIPTSRLDLTESNIQTIPVSINASDFALPGTYKILLSAKTHDVSVSQFVTVTVTV
jgi:virginiamycin B lyase